jgi:hypothetical protein
MTCRAVGEGDLDAAHAVAEEFGVLAQSPNDDFRRLRPGDVGRRQGKKGGGEGGWDESHLEFLSGEAD